jgi:hypothetical protein
MDLGTMSKKMKSAQYNSKEEFAKDLQLIWDNCFYYNSDPSSIYRVHATAMQNKTAELMKNVPNIRIKTRLEAEAAGERVDDEGAAGGEAASDDEDSDRGSNAEMPVGDEEDGVTVEVCHLPINILCFIYWQNRKMTMMMVLLHRHRWLEIMRRPRVN